MLASLIAGVVSGETLDALRRARRAAVAYVLAGILLLIGLAFFVGAYFVWLSQRVGTVEASLLFGGGFVALGVLVLLVHMVTRSVKARRLQRQRRSEMATIAAATGLAVLPTLLRGRASLGLLAAPAAAALVYAIWRENMAGRPPDQPGDGA